MLDTQLYVYATATVELKQTCLDQTPSYDTITWRRSFSEHKHYCRYTVYNH